MKKGLGRGMNSLFPDAELFTEEKPEVQGDVILKLTEIEPNKKQPRKDFDIEKINILADSIKEHGLIQPIVVMKQKSGRYTIVAGERRWRAAKQAGLTEVPVVIKSYSPEEAAEIALIENLQREDLNPVEEALGYKSLIDDFKMTQEEVSKKIGKSRSAIANTIRLLALDEKTLDYLKYGEITGGHARAILSLPEGALREELCERIITEDLNVRQAETIARLMLKRADKKPSKKKNLKYEIELTAMGEKLSSKFGTKVSLKPGAKRSKIEIEYYSEDDLERILQLLGI